MSFGDKIKTTPPCRSDEDQTRLEEQHRAHVEQVNKLCEGAREWMYEDLLRMLGLSSIDWDAYNPAQVDWALARTMEFFIGLDEKLSNGHLASASSAVSNGSDIQTREPASRATGTRAPRQRADAPADTSSTGGDPPELIRHMSVTPSSRRRKSGDSFTSAVPHFSWICAALGAIFGFVVASVTRDTLHYYGTASTVVSVLWILIITAISAIGCYGIGEAINRESDDG